MSRDLQVPLKIPTEPLENGHDASRSDIVDQSSPLVSSIHLVEDNRGEPSSARAPDTSSILLFPGSTDNTDDELETLLSENAPNPARVHFRSRVRITSGLSRQRHKSYTEHDYLACSSSSSISGSPSSSISAPLRTQSDDEVGKRGWVPLGQRVSLLANIQRKTGHRRERGLMVKTVNDGIIPCSHNSNMTERTPLTITTSHFQNRTDRDSIGVDEDRCERSRELSLVFGPWPGRLLNHHWWWWQIEPIICCLCQDDSMEGG